MADTLALGASAARHGGSSPLSPTRFRQNKAQHGLILLSRLSLTFRPKYDSIVDRRNHLLIERSLTGLEHKMLVNVVNLKAAIAAGVVK